MRPLIAAAFCTLLLLLTGLFQQEAFSRPGNSGAGTGSGPELSTAGGPPAAFALPRTDNERAKERARPGGPRLEEGQQLVVIPGRGAVISPS